MSSTESRRQAPKRTTRMRKTVAGLCLALGATVAVGVPAVAAQAGSSSTQAPDATTQSARRERIERACARVPDITARVDRFIAWLDGDAATKGSLAWLQTRIDAAAGAGRDQMVIVLQNRLDVRTARLALLHERREALTDIAQRCDENFGG